MLAQSPVAVGWPECVTYRRSMTYKIGFLGENWGVHVKGGRKQNTRMITRMCRDRNIEGRIRLADNHLILRRGLPKSIRQEHDFGVGADVEVIRLSQPDLVILDLRVPGECGLD